MKISPRIDFAFKKLFGSEENKEILRSFVNAILPADEQLTEIILMNPYNDKSSTKMKGSVLDIKAKDEKNRLYHIEMQVNNDKYYDKRALYYWSKLYSDQLLSGQPYSSLQKTISIHILNFDYFEQETDYHNIFHILNMKSHRREFEDLEFHFIELQKFMNTVKAPTERLDQWTNFLATVDKYDEKTLPPLFLSDPELHRAVEALAQLSFSSDEKEIYEGQLKQWRDLMSATETVNYKWLTEGVKIGKEEGVKIGKKEGVKIGKAEGVKLGKAEGVKIGKAEGKLEGTLEGERLILLRQLKSKFGDVADSVIVKINSYHSEQLLALSEKLLKVSKLSELFDDHF